MNTVKLKNGSEEAKVLVNVIWVHINKLLEDPMGGCIVLYELVMKCRDKKHEFFGNTDDRLKDLKLVENTGNVHNSIRNIILSSAIGEGLDMKFINPIA